MTLSSTVQTSFNPMLQQGSLPLFDQIKPEHVKPAVDALLQVASDALETVTAPSFLAEWNAIAQVLDVATERLSSAWGAVSHLNSVADSPELRAAYNESLPVVTEFWTRLGADERRHKNKPFKMHCATLSWVAQSFKVKTKFAMQPFKNAWLS